MNVILHYYDLDCFHFLLAQQYILERMYSHSIERKKRTPLKKLMNIAATIMEEKEKALPSKAVYVYRNTPY